MQAKILIVCLLVGAITFIGVFPSTCIAGDKEELVKFYESCISIEICDCQAKTALSKSRSANLRCYAAKKIEKMAFLKNNKDMLIKEMIKNDIGVKPHKIEHFLNNKFYELSVKSQDGDAPSLTLKKSQDGDVSTEI
jgi:hypothetical protein